MSGQALQEKIKTLDAHQGKQVFAVVATDGTTNAGIIDCF